jgi:hypothetical protein
MIENNQRSLPRRRRPGPHVLTPFMFTAQASKGATSSQALIDNSGAASTWAPGPALQVWAIRRPQLAAP